MDPAVGLFLGACLIVITLRGDDPTLTRFEFSEPHMGTLARVVLYAASEVQAREAAGAAFARIAELDRALSDYRPDSELMRFSRRAGEGPVAVSHDLFDVLWASQQLAERTGGAFDVTCGALTRVWRSARRLAELPSRDRVEAARAVSGYRLLVLDHAVRTASLAKPGVLLDLGGIAKGYAADAGLNVLATRGLTRSLVGLGGDIVVGDAPPDRAGWTLGVQRLKLPGSPALPPLTLVRASISTSGDAEQWLTVGGVRHSHILDLRRGWPMTGRSSTTAVAPHGIQADGLSTALAVLGPEQGRAIVEETPGAAALWVRARDDGTFDVQRSSRWPGGS